VKLITCCIANCDSEPYHSRNDSPYCPKCRANISGWKNKLRNDPSAARRRIANLARYADRMSYVAPVRMLEPMQFSNEIAYMKLRRPRNG
jgi:hypothetical protein